MKKIRKEHLFELAVFLMDYHSGQWSRGYRLLCRLGVGMITDSCFEECRESEIYQHLVAKYGDKV